MPSSQGSRRLRQTSAAAAALALLVACAPAAATATTPYRLSGRSLARVRGSVRSVADRGASGGRALALGRAGSAAGHVVLPGPAIGLDVRARAGSCARRAALAVSVDGARALRLLVTARRWADRELALSLGAGAHTLRVSTTGGARRACRDVVRIDSLGFTPSPSSGSAQNPLAGVRFYLSPDTSASRQVRAWRSSRPADAAQIEKIAAQPQATWFGDFSTNVQSDVSGTVDAATSAGQLPVLVAYDLPNLDCGGLSAGGASSPDAYRQWIRGFAAGIGSRRAVVLLEPDALAELDCLSPSDQQSYLSLISDAISVLSARPGVVLYVDAGNSHWQPPSVMAQRLSQVGAQRARGFALNVSNFQTTSSSLGYGRALSAQLGGLHFVIDTSRNGAGPTPDDQWCNPDGRALGTPPTTQTGDPLADALLWIKAPGESDGSCNGGPAAGNWWADYALGLAQRAAF